MFGLSYQKDLNILQEITKRENNKQPVSTGIYGYGRNEKAENVDFKTYNTKQNKLVRDIEKIYLDIKSELDDIQRIVDNTSSTKDKLEGKKVKTTLFQTSLNLMKEKSNIYTTVKKEKDATDKMTMMQNGGSTGVTGTGGSDANSLMNAFRTGATTNHSIATVPGGNSIVIQNVAAPTTTSTNYNVPTPTTSVENVNIPPTVIEVSETPQVQQPLENVQALEEPKVVENPVQNIIDKEPTEVVVNALGQQIVNKKAESFIPVTGINPLMELDYNRSLINIKNKDNPNIKDYFKYNVKEKMGWLVKFDEAEQKEVEGTVLPLEHIYPFKLNLQNRNMISSLNLSYKVILTDAEPSDEVKEFYHKRWEREEQEKLK